MVADTTQRKIPEADFVRYIDESLGKADPGRSIPWAVDSPPPWAKEFHPKVIWDLGCGLGAFTESIILCLDSWGCLDRLEKFILVEGDKKLYQQPEQGLSTKLYNRIKNVLVVCGRGDAIVEVCMENIFFNRKEGNIISSVSPLDGFSPPRADLIIASHITYYFEDGSGLSIVQALQSHHLQIHGKIWCVIRNLECPIYRMRRQVLKDLKIPDPKPYDYAESFHAKVLPRLKGLQLKAEKSNGYNINGPQCLKISYVLMWREMPGLRESSYKRASQAVCGKSDPLFEETHFILENQGEVG